MQIRFTLPSVVALWALAACADVEVSSPPDPEAAAFSRSSNADPRAIAEGREIFRFDDFGNWRFWTDTAQLHRLVEGVTPRLALGFGLKVDADAVDAEVLQAVLSSEALLNSPAVTRELLRLDAVVGLSARVEGDHITRIGVTCALCHSTVDNSVTTGIGTRLDGWPNRELALGEILTLLPGLPTIADALGVPAELLVHEYDSWDLGYYDARVNLDGRFADPPILIPPAYGLHGVGLETYTGEGPISYWNRYVAVTQMHGRGSFSDPRLGVRIVVAPQEDEVSSKLPSLARYQFSLEAPLPPQGSFDPAAAARGRAVFAGVARCTDCHTGPRLTNGRLHAPSATGMEPTWAERGTTGGYRATPLRGLWHRRPYFHDGSAATLGEVVDHYERVLSLGLSAQQRHDLIEYLKSL